MMLYVDPAVPPTRVLFRPVHDRYGLRLAIVLGNQAPEGLCPYFRVGLCHHCDIGIGEGIRFESQDNLRRIQWLEAHYASILPEVRHLVIYNSGSTLNPIELSVEVRNAVLILAHNLPNLKVVSMDSRECFVQEDVVTNMALLLGHGKELRIVLAIESADDRIRNGILQKRMPRKAIEAAVRSIATVSKRAEGSSTDSIALLGVSFNIMIGAPGTSTATAVSDAVSTAKYAVELANYYNLQPDLNLHPYYPSRRGLLRFPAHQSTPVEVVIQSILAITDCIGDNAMLFVGLQDEGHNQAPTLPDLDTLAFEEQLEKLNRTGCTTHLQERL